MMTSSWGIPMWRYLTLTVFALVTLVIGALYLRFASLNLIALSTQEVWNGGTIYIRPDGKVEPSNAPILSIDNQTYILVRNILAKCSDIGALGIVVERDGIVFDGNGYSVEAECSFPVYLYGRSNITVRNINLRGVSHGIILEGSKNILIVNTTVENLGGIYIYNSENVSIVNNYLTHVLVGSSRSVVIYNNRVEELAILTSIAINVSNNYVTARVYILEVFGSNISFNTIERGISLKASYSNTIVGNTAKGRLIAYYENVSDIVISGENLSQVIIVNGFNITLVELSLLDVVVGIQLLNVTNSKVVNSVINNTDSGIYLEGSSNNEIAGNIVSSIYTPILLTSSHGNVFTNNTIFGTVQLWGSANNTFMNNVIYGGFDIYDFYGVNTILANTINVGDNCAIHFQGIVGTLIITSNNITSNRCGIGIAFGGNHTIAFNRISSTLTTHVWRGIVFESSYNNIVVGNVIEGVFRDPTDIVEGLVLFGNGNIVVGNMFVNNRCGISIARNSKNNVFLYNNFLQNNVHVCLDQDAGANIWDDGTIGNYWSFHKCDDKNNDDTCENPYVIRSNDNVDRCPLKYPIEKVPENALDKARTLRDLAVERDASGFNSFELVTKPVADISSNIQLSLILVAIIITLVVIVIIKLVKVLKT